MNSSFPTQRLVSGGDEMSLDARLSDYCKAKSHVIYLVVRFPGVSYADSPQENDLEDAEVETGESSATPSEVSTRANPRIVLRGTVTIPVGTTPNPSITVRSPSNTTCSSIFLSLSHVHIGNTFAGARTGYAQSDA